MRLAVAENGTIWIATTEGLLRGHVADDGITFKRYRATSDDATGLRSNKLSSVLVAPNNPEKLWISSLGGGISSMDVGSETFTHWSQSTGQLSNDYVYGLLADDAGDIWWSSNQGLSRYSPDTGKFSHFNINDGLPTNEFNQLAYAKAPDGTLYFGCVEGLVGFDPEDIVPNNQTPLTRITSLKVNGRHWEKLEKQTGRIKDPAFLSAIRLPHYQNNLDLQFTGLEYSAPAKQRFRFYLEGAEESWGTPTDRNRVSYLNLPPGRYVFRVVAANGDGVWHEAPTKLSIRILPPWWQTTAAYVCYVLLALLLLASLTYYLLRRQSYRFRLQSQRRETERLEELHRFRASLYQCVTHEFRSPLSIINSIAREWQRLLPSTKQQQEAGTVLRSSQRMLDQVDRMLKVATVEHNQLPYHARMGDVPAFLRQMLEERRPAFRNAGLSLTLV
ncbi:MAG: triple tyrosine motif-containing protein, partial [Bacteroidota bacterium]